MKDATPGRQLVIDQLRGLAAVWVALFHFNEPIPFEPTFYREFCKLGWLGVPAFFVISGYCISQAADRSRSVGGFLSRRFWRIWPPYAASLVVVLAILAVRWAATGTNDMIAIPKSAMGWLATLTLTTSPATAVPGINWVYWSLTVEATFYLVVAGALAAGRFRRTALLAVTLLTLLPVPPPQLLFWLPFWPEFAVGVAVYELSCGRRRWAAALILPAIAGAFLHRPPESAATAAIVAAIIAVEALGYLSFAHRFAKPLTRLGDWSYSLYLLHVPIGCYALGWVIRPNEASAAANMLFDAFALAVCVVASWVFHLAVERPSIAIGRGGIDAFPWIYRLRPWRLADAGERA